MSPHTAGVWLGFCLCAALVGLAGPALSRNGDVIATRLNLSGGWISFGLFAMYLLNAYVLFLHGAR